MQVELRQFRYFLAVADELNFTRAAERLHIAPQALSEAIKQLETQLGLRLFDRTTRRVELTDAGTALLTPARRTLKQAEHAVETARRTARGELGSLRVGFLSSTANYVLPPLVRAFRERHPDVVLRTEDDSIGALVAGVREGRLDAAITRPPLLDGDAELTTETILSEPVAAVLPAGHALADRASLRLADLAAERWVMTDRSSWPPWHRQYDEDFRSAGFEPDIVARGNSVQSLLALVAAGVGVTRLALSSRTLRHTGVAFVPLEGDTARVVILTRRAESRPALARFLEVVREVASTHDLLSAG